MSTISAGTSNTTSLIYTGDTTGNLAFQTNGTTEAMRVTSLQRVGIGSSTPQSPLEVYGLIRTTGFVSNPSSGAGMELAWDGTQGIVQAYSDRAALTTAPVYFTGGQIKFPATQNASSDPNTLDDYEEGTWTPVITPQSGTLSGYSSVGSYVRVGRQVSICGKFTITSVGSSSGFVQIAGYPFTADAAFQVCGSAREGGSTGNLYTAILVQGATYGYIFGNANAGVSWSNSYTYYWNFTFFV